MLPSGIRGGMELAERSEGDHLGRARQLVGAFAEADVFSVFAGSDAQRFVLLGDDSFWL